jgi:hypothetical protein
MADEDKAEHDPPICPRCNAAERIKPLSMSDMVDGVRYWWCDSCGHVWGTRYRKAPDPPSSAKAHEPD